MGGQFEGNCVDLTHLIRQKCIATILKVFESAARTGVRCLLPAVSGGDAEMLLFPSLGSMNLDSPDARVYFGLLNKCCCSKCNRRKGRSAFRVGKVQRGSVVRCLYGIVEHCTDDVMARRASEKLERLGFNPWRRCLLPYVCDMFLIRRPGFEDEVFPGVDFRDRLHALCIYLHRRICESFVAMRLSKQKRVLLDRRLNQIGLSRCLHKPSTGKTYRTQRTIFSEAHMTAEDRVCLIFLLPHVLGPRSLDLPQELREPVLTALSYAQIFIIAVHGLRPYNTRELNEIFTRGWIIFHGSLESIHRRNHDLIFTSRMKRYRKNPQKNKRPKQFEQKSR